MLDQLSDADFALPRPHWRGVTFAVGDILIGAMQPFPKVYFVTEGLVSVIASADQRHDAEVGIHGYEGMGSTASVLGSDRRAYQHTVQREENGWCIEPARLSEALRCSDTLAAILLRYAQAFNVMTAYTALANCGFTLDKRIARWLLMCQDRAQDLHIVMTHDLLASLLHARRPSVTHALHALEGDGHIRAKRGQIRIVDRAGLRRVAGASYGVPEAEYARLIGPPAIFADAGPDSLPPRIAPEAPNSTPTLN